MKKVFVLLLACLMAVNVSAQKTTKSSSSGKKASSTKTTSSKKSTGKKKAPQATLEKGTFFFNTNATNISFNSISIGSADGGSSKNLIRFGLQGQGGYAISNNLALVAGVGFQYGKMEATSATVFNITAGARYYVIPNLYVSGMLVFGTLGLNAELGGMVDSETIDPKDLPSGAMKGNTLGLDLGVGYSIWLSKRIALEPNLSYSIGLSTQFENAKYKMNALTVNLGFTILL